MSAGIHKDRASNGRVPFQLRLGLAPTAPLSLGLAGLLPFIACTGALFVTDASGQETVWRYLIAYGAVIVSFVGALHWAFAMGNTDGNERMGWILYGWSVVPALLGWLALGVRSHIAAVFILIVGFVLQFLFDARHSRYLHLPRWFLPLRGLLSSVAVLCLAIAGASFP